MTERLTVKGRPMRSERVAISLTPADKQALEDRARESGMSTAMLANLVVRAYLADPDAVLPGLARTGD